MIRALLYVSAIIAAAIGLSWLADRPGELVVNWQGYEVQTSVFRAIVMAALLAVGAVAVWSVFRLIMTSPASVGHFFRRQRQEKGLKSLSAGMIAVASGDRALATQYAKLAHKSMPNEPLTHLLRAQAAQLSGDRATARRIYESMRNHPETELLGLRGLYLEAQHEQEPEAARQYAERAVALNPRLGWSNDSLFAIQCKDGDWQGALDTLAKTAKHDRTDKTLLARRRAVLLTAQASELEDSEAARALVLATEAHGLAPDLVPAAAIAGRLLASQGATPKAAKILQRTWRRMPHPDISTAYAYARIGDSPRDRLARIRDLASLTPHNDEGQIAVAVAAIDAQEWETARRALQHLVADKPGQRVCTLMARIEGGQHGDSGKVREWLGRAAHGVRDPAWVADGHVSSKWHATSPVTGALDAFEWRQPADTLERIDTDLLAEQFLPPKANDQLVIDKARAQDGIEIKPSAPARTVETPPVKPGDRSPAAVSAVQKAAAPQPAAYPNGGPNGHASSPSTSTNAADAASGRVAAPLRPSLTNPANGAEAASAAARTSGSVDQSLRAGKDDKPRTLNMGGTATGQSPMTRVQSSVPAKSADRTLADGAGVDPLAGLRAPDDPGPDAAPDVDEVRAPITRFRVPSAKGPL